MPFALRRFLVLLAVTTLILGGCGLFGSDDQATDTTVSDENGEVTRPPTDIVDDAIAADALITPADLPVGWVGTSFSPELVEAIYASVDACTQLSDHVSESLDARSGTSELRSFEAADGERMDMIIDVYPDDDVAEAFVDGVRAAQPEGCIEGIIQEHGEVFGVEAGAAIEASVEPQSGLADDSVTVEIRTSTPTGPLTIRESWVQVGRAAITTTIALTGANQLDEEQVVGTVAERLRRSFGDGS